MVKYYIEAHKTEKSLYSCSKMQAMLSKRANLTKQYP